MSSSNSCRPVPNSILSATAARRKLAPRPLAQLDSAADLNIKDRNVQSYVKHRRMVVTSNVGKHSDVVEDSPDRTSQRPSSEKIVDNRCESMQLFSSKVKVIGRSAASAPGFAAKSFSATLGRNAHKIDNTADEKEAKADYYKIMKLLPVSKMIPQPFLPLAKQQISTNSLARQAGTPIVLEHTTKLQSKSTLLSKQQQQQRQQQQHQQQSHS